MSGRALGVLLGLAVSGGVAAWGQLPVRSGHDSGDVRFAFAGIAQPSMSDAATSARFEVISGKPDGNSAALSVLQDGDVPHNADDPRQNFFFQAGTQGGRILVDMQRSVAVEQVNTYSWHRKERGPQRYTLYGASGKRDNFDPRPGEGVDPRSCGWVKVAEVDTFAGDDKAGGQYAVSVGGRMNPLGSLQYLLFDIRPGSDKGPFNNTFYSEIDVVEIGGEAPQIAEWLQDRPVQVKFATRDRATSFVVDLSDAPEMQEWVEKRMRPMIVEWYPKLEKMLASPGFKAQDRVELKFRHDMGGVPAVAGGRGIGLNAGWFDRERDGEALGCVVHELVHIVQGYKRPVPGWIVEGVADYVRWFLFEPEKSGARINRRRPDGLRYDRSYRISANFIDWCVRTHDRDLLRKLNQAAREGSYNEDLWRSWTGKGLDELNSDWLK